MCLTRFFDESFYCPEGSNFIQSFFNGGFNVHIQQGSVELTICKIGLNQNDDQPKPYFNSIGEDTDHGPASVGVPTDRNQERQF